jgi:hypothetical protein
MQQACCRTRGYDRSSSQRQHCCPTTAAAAASSVALKCIRMHKGWCLTCMQSEAATSTAAGLANSNSHQPQTPFNTSHTKSDDCAYAWFKLLPDRSCCACCLLRLQVLLSSEGLPSRCCSALFTAFIPSSSSMEAAEPADPAQ